MQTVIIRDATLYLGNNMEIMDGLRADAVITDPPYGIGADEAAAHKKGKNRWKYYGDTTWDRSPPPKEVFDLMRKISKDQIIWGGNYFTDSLPPTMQWLVWDKGQRDFSLADCEFAWSNQQRAARIFDYSRGKAMQDGKEHPTQKPVELMKWCLGFVPKARSVLDPFMGSGTTGVACAKKGVPFTGIEINEEYFQIACRRIEQAYAQPDMFVAQTVVEKQETLC